MQAITLFHRGVPVVYQPLSGPKLTIGSDPRDDLILAGDNIAERHLTITRGPAGGWCARVLGEGGERIENALDPGTRVAVGQYAVELVNLTRGASGDDGGGREGNAALPASAIVGVSARIRLVRDDLGRLAGLRVPVLVEGETGTGKELAARTLHAASKRAGGPFVAINCGALAPTMIEDVLFGHERGSFTGAGTSHRGVFERADGGTLFLDEIGELPACHQASLLRVLDNGRVSRLGSEREEAVDVRLVTATNRDLRRMAEAGSFRADLYHRLATLKVSMPPLRDRSEDVAPLARHFLAAMADDVGAKALSDGALEALAAHSWPGNARELRNVLYRAAAVCSRRVITEADLEIEPPRELIAPARFTLEELPEARIRELVARHAGNVASAARELGVPRSTLRDHLRRRSADVTVAREPRPTV